MIPILLIAIYALGLSSVGYAQSLLSVFSDIGPSNGSPSLTTDSHLAPFYRSALLRARSIIVGCSFSPTNYCPKLKFDAQTGAITEGSFTRAQAAVFIVRAIYAAKYGNPEAFQTVTTPYFPGDVPATNTYFRWVQQIKLLGITSGTGQNSQGQATFSPDGTLSNGEVAVFVVRAWQILTQSVGSSSLIYPAPDLPDVYDDQPFMNDVHRILDNRENASFNVVPSPYTCVDLYPNDPCINYFYKYIRKAVELVGSPSKATVNEYGTSNYCHTYDNGGSYCQGHTIDRASAAYYIVDGILNQFSSPPPQPPVYQAGSIEYSRPFPDTYAPPTCLASNGSRPTIISSNELLRLPSGLTYSRSIMSFDSSNPYDAGSKYLWALSNGALITGSATFGPVTGTAATGSVTVTPIPSATGYFWQLSPPSSIVQGNTMQVNSICNYVGPNSPNVDTFLYSPQRNVPYIAGINGSPAPTVVDTNPAQVANLTGGQTITLQGSFPDAGSADHQLRLQLSNGATYTTPIAVTSLNQPSITVPSPPSACNWDASTGAQCTMSVDVLLNGTWKSGTPAVNVSISSGTVSVLFQMSSLSGLQMTIDGQVCTSPSTCSFSWVPGTNHSIILGSPQIPAGTPAGTRYRFNQWLASTGGTPSATGSGTYILTAPGIQTTYSALFTTQYTLTTGTIPSLIPAVTVNTSPSTADCFQLTAPALACWYDSGTNVTLTATAQPSSGYSFTNFQGSASSPSNPTGILLNGPKYMEAVFAGPNVMSFSARGRTYTIESKSIGTANIGSAPDRQGDWKGHWLYEVSVVKASANQWYMLFATNTVKDMPGKTPGGQAFYYATSSDGVTFTNPTRILDMVDPICDFIDARPVFDGTLWHVYTQARRKDHGGQIDGCPDSPSVSDNYAYVFEATGLTLGSLQWNTTPVIKPIRSQIPGVANDGYLSTPALVNNGVTETLQAFNVLGSLVVQYNDWGLREQYFPLARLESLTDGTNPPPGVPPVPTIPTVPFPCPDCPASGSNRALFFNGTDVLTSSPGTAGTPWSIYNIQYGRTPASAFGQIGGVGNIGSDVLLSGSLDYSSKGTPGIAFPSSCTNPNNNNDPTANRVIHGAYFFDNAISLPNIAQATGGSWFDGAYLATTTASVFTPLMARDPYGALSPDTSIATGRSWTTYIYYNQGIAACHDMQTAFKTTSGDAMSIGVSQVRITER